MISSNSARKAMNTNTASNRDELKACLLNPSIGNIDATKVHRSFIKNVKTTVANGVKTKPGWGRKKQFFQRLAPSRFFFCQWSGLQISHLDSVQFGLAGAAPQRIGFTASPLTCTTETPPHFFS